MLKKLSEKLRAKFPATTPGCSMKKMEKKGRRKKIPKIEKPEDVGHFQNFDFCACLSHNVVKRDAGGKKGKLLCWKRIFNRIKDNLAEIQLKLSTKMFQKRVFCKKFQESMG